MRRIREKTAIGDGSVKEGSLRRRRGGRRKEKGMVRRRWKRGSIEDSMEVSDMADPVDVESVLGAIDSDPHVGSTLKLNS